MLHSKDVALQRLGEIVAMVNDLEDAAFNLDSWFGYDDCGTVCCVAGWMAKRGMYGMHVDPLTAHTSLPALVVEGGKAHGYNAMAYVLFGGEWDDEDLVSDIVQHLFQPATATEMCHGYVSQKRVFSERVAAARVMIDMLYDE